MRVIFLLIFLFSCTQDDKSLVGKKVRRELITRHEGEEVFKPHPPKPLPPPDYPWNQGNRVDLPRITKEFFRCKGSPLNPARKEVKGGETLEYTDCGGSAKHGLPLFEGKEGVYPILISLLNYIQNQTGKKVVITSGHRCPDHNTYLSASPAYQVSKHLIGAEVSFYVQGYEERPEAIVQLIQNYYLHDPEVKEDKRYTQFARYEKEDVDVSTLPWMNQEIFLKLYKKQEGRDFDNRHPYPYLSLQVRYDRDKKSRVFYSWDKAYNNFHRY